MVPEMNRGTVGFLRHVAVENGKFYQISHDSLPPRTPSWLRSIQVVLVSEMNNLKVTVKYPSLESLKESMSTGLTGFCPSLDMSFIMGPELAKRVLLWQVSDPDFCNLEDIMGFWLLDSSLLAPKLEREEVSPKYLSSSTIDYEEEKLDEIDDDEVKVVVVKEENVDGGGGFGREDGSRKRKFKWWSEKSFEAGKDVIFGILKEKNATVDNPIFRTALRKEAQKQIGNTGLLDHLLKDIPGKISSDGVSRFRRCYSSFGVIVYWLESVDLIDVRKQSGGIVPFYNPQPGLKLDACSTKCACAKDLELLKEDLSKVKRELEDTKKQLDEMRSANISSGLYSLSPDRNGWVGGFW